MKAQARMVPERVSRTRKALIEAGKRLISRGGMDGASIDDIVHEADVSKGSFYNHFTDREHLATEVRVTVKKELERRIAEVNEGVDDLAIYFARGMLASFRYGLDDKLSARVVTQITAGLTDPASPRNTQVAAIIQEGIDRGVLKLQNVDTGLVLLFGLSDLGVSRLIDLHDEFQRAREVMRGVCIVLLRGFGIEARRIERVVDDALDFVIDEPRKRANGADALA